jgi:hypothetical protein
VTERQGPEWRVVAERLGRIVEAFLDEFFEMCRRSDNEEAAHAALEDLRATSEGEML